MKKYLVLVLIGIMACNAFGRIGGSRIGGSSVTLNNTTDVNLRDVNVGGWLRGAFTRGNAMYVAPEANLQTALDTLESSVYDATMGALSPSAWRTLILSPGTYTANLVADVNYIVICSSSDEPNSTKITASTGSTLLVNAWAVKLRGVRVDNSGSSTWAYPAIPSYIGVDINCGYGSESPSFTNCWFTGTAKDTLYIGSVPVWFRANSRSIWRDCHSTSQSWRGGPNVTIAGIAEDCGCWLSTIKEIPLTGQYGFSCWGGDQTGTLVDMNMTNYIGGENNLGGCIAFGCDVHGNYDNIRVGHQSVALQSEFVGTITNSILGEGSIAAGDYCATTDTNAYFCGVSRNNIISGKGSEGLYINKASSYFSFAEGNNTGLSVRSQGIHGSSIIENCYLGSGRGFLNEGNTIRYSPLFSASPATLTTKFANGSGANVVITALNNGPTYNLYSFRYATDAGPTWTCSVSASGVITVTKGSSASKTGADLLAKLNATSAFTALFSAALAGDGTALLSGTTTTWYFGGGSDGPVIRNNRNVPVKFSGNAYVRPIFSGAEYIYTGATAANVYLPQAGAVAMNFWITDGNNTATADPNIKPYDGDYIIKIDGTALDVNEGYHCESDAYAKVRLVHNTIDPNIWREELIIGTWTEESPP